MLGAIIVSVIYHENVTHNLFHAFGITFVSGILLYFLTRKQRHVEPNRHESVFIVTFGWFILGIFAALPYLFTQAIPNFTNAFFESVSGITTTGASILTDIESLPKSILFWRAETHWIGGMGIIVLVIAIMPFLQIHGIYLYYSEISNVAEEKVSSRIRQTARNLWLIYVGLTIIEIIVLTLGKMPLFDSICHSFATIATGGFSTQNDSISGYSPFIQYVITFFMFLSGINFALHILSLKGNFSTTLKNDEFRLYSAIIIITTIIVTLILITQQHISPEHAFRQSAFQVVSILTATGFSTADYLEWPLIAILLIALLMLIGASSGSTGGGVKVIRHSISLKKIKQMIQDIISPTTINVVRYNGKSVDDDYVSRVISFIVFYYGVVLIGTFVMLFFGQSMATSFGSVATCMGGIGPGFGTVGPASNFFHLPAISKYFLVFIMIVGRLEIYSVMVLFTRSFWKL